MTRIWTALALLSASWLFGLSYYQSAQSVTWIAAIVVGALLLAGCPLELPKGRAAALAFALLCVPILLLLPSPYRAAPLLLAVGVALAAAPIPGRWPASFARGAASAGLVLLVQGIVLKLDTAQLARNHDLPWPLAWLVGGAARLLGIDMAVDGSTVAVHSLRQVHRMAASWELLLDPATLAFLVGGLVFLGIAAWHTAAPDAWWRDWLRGARRLTLVTLAWLPIRTGLLIAVYLHRAVRTDAAERLNLMNQFFSPWVYLAMLLPLVLLAWRFVPLPTIAPPVAETGPQPLRRRGELWHAAASLGLVAVAVAVAAMAIQWSPVGRRMGGRVMFVERHSKWEPTDRPYDTKTFGEKSSYTYTAIYNDCSQFYEMSRLAESQPINDDSLAACDVLVVKTVSDRYAFGEIAAIERFVDRGGGLLLIGEHTDPNIQTPYLNNLAGRFGFRFRQDVLLRIGDSRFQDYAPPAVPHPVVQFVPPMVFAVSCSVDPGSSRGEAVIRETGLWSLPADYHMSNYFPEPEQRAEARFGPFIQLWAAHHGWGRVLAWTDSTIFSSWCTFEPGKAELMLGMLEWLNHTSVLDHRWIALAAGLCIAVLVILVAAIGLRWGYHRRVPWIVLIAAALFGWALASRAVATVHRWAMPPPELLRPLPRVLIDRTVSKVPLCRDGYTQPDGRGFGLLEQWIPRLGYVTTRATGPDAFSGDMLVVLCPTQSIPEEYRQQLQDYVVGGGKLLVIDSPETVGSTANSLLWPLGMSVRHATSRKGLLTLADGWPAIPVEGACEIVGGEPFLWVDGLSVGARKRYGEGSVMALGFGAVLNDAGLGASWMNEPGAGVLLRSDLLFAVVRGAVEEQPVAQPPSRESAKKKPSKSKAAPAKKRRPRS